jgi:hypothetical protein
MEKKPYQFQIDGKQITAGPDELGICMFREKRDVEYIDYHTWDEAEQTERHCFIFGHREWLIWLGGIAIDADDAHTLHHADRNNGSFRQNFGWNPPVRIDDEPTEWEIGMWSDAMTPDDLHADLNRAISEDFNA